MSDKSNRKIKYVCTRCGQEVGRNNLRVKRALFAEIGRGGSQVRSRTVAWLCVLPKANGAPSCCDLDEDWNAPKWTGSPGLADISEGNE